MGGFRACKGGGVQQCDRGAKPVVRFWLLR